MKRVYFMRPVGQDGPIKIGCSSEPAHRLRSVEIWSPIKLEILATAPGDHAHENVLHRQFVDQRLHGEWFAVSPALTDLIDYVVAHGALPLMQVPANPREWNALRARTRGLARRNDSERLCKSRLTRAVNTAERRVYGYAGYQYARPPEIDEIIRGYHGFSVPTPTPEQVALIDRYIALLADMPDADRSFTAWLDWHDRFAGRESAAA